MVVQKSNIADYNEKYLEELFNKNIKPFPELEKYRSNPSEILNLKQTKPIIEVINSENNSIANIPILTKALYKDFEKTGDRSVYEDPYDNRRKYLSIATFLHFTQKENYKLLIEEYLNAICDEDTWVIPAHDGRLIDLYAADTALTLSVVLYILKDLIDTNVQKKVIQTIDAKVFSPYLNKTVEHKWYKLADNWNAVCNSEIATAFLLIEKDSKRKAHAIKTALVSLQVYLANAFLPDGSTSEGINYWNYGMSMFIRFSEVLRDTTNGGIDLLSNARVKTIATFPLNMQIGFNSFAPFSDTTESSAGTTFNPGIIQRLYERTGITALKGLIVDPVRPDWLGISTVLSYILWWDGSTTHNVKVTDTLLPDAGIAKLTFNADNSIPITLIVKAGNNGENHNHNDVGSFVFNIDGENILTDPGAGAYSKDYFSEKRYENIFANSYGHNVPTINGKFQASGSQYFGKIINCALGTEVKKVKLEMNNAYDVKELSKFTREVQLSSRKGEPLLLEDKFSFNSGDNAVEEAFVTWDTVIINEGIVSIKGEKLCIELLVTSSNSTVAVSVQNLDEECKANKKTKTLKRICYNLTSAEAKDVDFMMKVKIVS